MKEYITKEHKHLLWQDELGEPFLLTRQMEIYDNGDDCFGVYAWGAKEKVSKLSKEEGFAFDDGFTRYLVPKKALGALLALNKMRRRPHIQGKWVAGVKDRLAHDILPYRPHLDEK